NRTGSGVVLICPAGRQGNRFSGIGLARRRSRGLRAERGRLDPGVRQQAWASLDFGLDSAGVARTFAQEYPCLGAHDTFAPTGEPVAMGGIDLACGARVWAWGETTDSGASVRK